MLGYGTQTELKDKQVNFLKILFAYKFSHIIMFLNFTKNKHAYQFHN